MIYDCFMFNHELDMLEIRLNVLNDVVDKFVLVESSKTHTGFEKTLHYAENKDRFKEFNDKIIHLVIDDFPTEGVVDEAKRSWVCESFQRNYIMNGLKDAKDEDVIAISDVDEIPNAKTFLKTAHRLNSGEGRAIYALFMADSMYYLNNLVVGLPWTWDQTTKMLLMKDIREGILNEFTIPSKLHSETANIGTTPTKIKLYHGEKQVRIKNGGWHFSACMTKAQFQEKINSNAIEVMKSLEEKKKCHENLDELMNVKFIANIYRTCTVKLEGFLPDYIIQNKEKYKGIIKQEKGLDIRLIKFLHKSSRTTRKFIYKYGSKMLLSKEDKEKFYKYLRLQRI